jgi:hypothetical protein
LGGLDKLEEKTSNTTTAISCLVTIVGGIVVLLIAKFFISTIIDHWVISLIITLGVIAAGIYYVFKTE